MDERTYKLIGEDYPGNRAEDVINPSLWWMTGFLVVVSFLGLFSLVPLRKVTTSTVLLLTLESDLGNYVAQQIRLVLGVLFFHCVVSVFLSSCLLASIVLLFSLSFSFSIHISVQCMYLVIVFTLSEKQWSLNL